MQTLSYENEFDLHEKEPARGTHFHLNSVAPRLVLTQKYKVLARKWPIPAEPIFHE